MEYNNVYLSTPCKIYYNKVCSIFAEDPEIEVCSQEINGVCYINITVISEQKVAALKELLNDEVQIENKKIIITVAKKEMCECCMYQCKFKNLYCNNCPNTCFYKNIVLIVFGMVLKYLINKNIHIR